MSIIDGLTNVYNDATASAKGLLGNPTATAIGGALAGAAVAGTIAVAVSKSKKRRNKARRKSKSKTYKRKSTKRRKTYKYARTARKKKDRSTRRIRMTKNGQPYVILANGRARFIKKKSARISRKRKGGRY